MTLQMIKTAVEPVTERGAKEMSSGWCYFTGQGDVVIDAHADWITPSTQVYASIVEVDDNDMPKMGDARMTVHNVEPYQGGIRTWVSIEWDSPLRVRISASWSE